MPERAIDGDALDGLRAERLDHRFKAIPASGWGLTVAEYASARPALASLGTPMLTLDAAALDHNLATMARYCLDTGVAIAPHGKTTMAPQLWRRQLDAGAWGITLANVPQLRVAAAFGVRRVMLANTVVDPAALAWLAGLSDFSVVSWVDSLRTVELMDAALRAAGAERPFDVCVELGGLGGRTGVRDLDEAERIAQAISVAPMLRLVGVAGYEGALAHGSAPDALAAVDGYLNRVAELYQRLAKSGLFADDLDEVLVSAGGSAYFDQVVSVLGSLRDGRTRVLLRSGAYVIHDDGYYRGISPLGRGAGPEPLHSAMHGWARVISRPEPGLAILDAGKRDLPFDDGLPRPLGADLAGATVTKVMDQHTFVSLPHEAETAVGDVVRLGLSHPCTALDKWTLIPVVDDAGAAEPVVVDFVRTFF